MRFDVITLFEPMFAALLEHGITGRAFKRSLFEFNAWNPRDVTEDVHRTVDDRPYGGGPGMVMLAEPLLKTIAQIRRQVPATTVIVPTPTGRRFDQQLLTQWMSLESLTFVCGRYEAIDQRVLSIIQPIEVSLGDFVVSGGELPVMTMMDAMIRRLPGAMQSANSVEEDSFEQGLLDCGHYSRPEVLNWEGQTHAVPPVLLSGHHANIARWRRQEMLRLTVSRRPDLIAALEAGETDQSLAKFSKEDKTLLKELGYNLGLSSSELLKNRR